MISQRFSTLSTTVIGLVGLSLMVLLHELGHFVMCKIFGVQTPVFSIGFGPALLGHQFGQTYFQIAMLPLGGYVSISHSDLAALPYIPMALIILAGIMVNLIFAFMVFAILRRPRLSYYSQLLRSFLTKEHMNGIIGPIGIITIIGMSLQFGWGFFLFILAILSLNLAFFNVLPIPFFDGGQLLWNTLERIFGPLSAEITQFIYLILFIMLIIITLLIATRDIWRLRS